MKADFDIDNYINEALKQEPDFLLSPDFAEKMTEKISRRYFFQESLKEYSIYVAVFVGLAVFVCTFLLYINKENLSQISGFITGHLAEIVSLVFIANFILFADKVLLRMLFILKQQ